MKQNRLGRTDIHVSELCLGTMMYVSQMPEAEAWQQMDRALEAGINFFDTAEVYPVPSHKKYVGRSEEVIGDWMADRKARDKVIVATKVAGRTQTDLVRSPIARVRPADIFAACESSLRKLKTDYIDLYQIHWPDRSSQLWGDIGRGFRHLEDDGYPIADAVDAMATLQQQGKIRCYGISNESPWGTMQYLGAAGADDSRRPASIQNNYHLLARNFEYGLAEMAMREDIGLLPYSPIAQGFLSGKYLGGAVPKGSRKDVIGKLLRNFEHGEASLLKYLDIAERFGITPSQLAMAFCLSREFVTSTIFGASNPGQLEEVIGSCAVEWTAELNEAVAAVHRACPNPCP